MKIDMRNNEVYMDARREFINCLCMSIFGVGYPIVLAFKEWLPIMRAEKAKALKEQQGAA